MLVGVHTHVYASGGESNVGCLHLPPLDCLDTGWITRPSMWVDQSALSISLSLLTNATGVTRTAVGILSFLHRFWEFKGKSRVVVLTEQTVLPIEPFFQPLFYAFFWRQSLVQSVAKDVPDPFASHSQVLEMQTCATISGSEWKNFKKYVVLKLELWKLIPFEISWRAFIEHNSYTLKRQKQNSKCKQIQKQ